MAQSASGWPLARPGLRAQRRHHGQRLFRGPRAGLIATVPEQHTHNLRAGMFSFDLPFQSEPVTVSMAMSPVSAVIGWFGWPAIFLVNVPLGFLAFGMAFLSLPRTASTRVAAVTFDHLGTLVLALTLAAYATAMATGRGRFGAVNAVLLLVAAGGALLFVRVEARAPSPLVRMSILREAHFSSSFAMSALVASVVMATLVVGPFYLAGALGLSAAATGLAMSAGPLAAALMGMPAGRLVDRFGHGAMTRTAGMHLTYAVATFMLVAAILIARAAAHLPATCCGSRRKC